MKAMNEREYERIKELLTRYGRGELDEAGERELAAWRESDAEHEEMFGRLMSARNMEEGIRRFVKSPEEDARTWERILDRTLRRSRRARRLAWIRYAAAVVLVIGAGSAMWWLSGRTERRTEPVVVARIEPGKARAELILPEGRRVLLDETAPDTVAGRLSRRGDTLSYASAAQEPAGLAVETHALRIPRGGEYTLVLADGTTVYLNAETELRYPARFTGGERRVELTGEAYFDVATDEGRPFVVETEEVAVRVYGTEFNVTAYEGEVVRTTLVEGKVGMRGKKGEEEVRLSPGQMGEYDAQKGKIEVREVDTYVYTAWKNGKFVFDEEPVEEIMERLARWYDLEVFYANEEVKRQIFSGVITRFTDVQEVLYLIECTATVHFEVKGKVVIVK